MLQLTSKISNFKAFCFFLFLKIINIAKFKKIVIFAQFNTFDRKKNKNMCEISNKKWTFG